MLEAARNNAHGRGTHGGQKHYPAPRHAETSAANYHSRIAGILARASRTDCGHKPHRAIHMLYATRRFGALHAAGSTRFSVGLRRRPHPHHCVTPECTIRARPFQLDQVAARRSALRLRPRQVDPSREAYAKAPNRGRLNHRTTDAAAPSSAPATRSPARSCFYPLPPDH